MSKNKATKCSLNFVRARMWPQTVPSMAECWVLRTKRYHLAQLDLVVWSENQTGTVPHAKPLVNMFSESLKPVGVPAFPRQRWDDDQGPQGPSGRGTCIGSVSSRAKFHKSLPWWTASVRHLAERKERTSEPSERKGNPMELAPKWTFLHVSTWINCNVSLGAPQLPYFPACHTTDLLWEFLWISPCSCPSNVKLTHKNCVVNCTGSFGS